MNHKRTVGNEVIAVMAGECLIMRTRLISRILTGIYDEGLRPFGINSPQLALLMVMFGIGAASRAEIGRCNHQDRSTLTRNLKIMLTKGWIEEVRGEAGARARPMLVTQTGEAILRDVAPAWRLAQEKAKAVLGQEGVRAITQIANGIIKFEPAA